MISTMNVSKKLDNEEVHPPLKSSSSKLSNKSLEMCTESLGSESGSDVGDTDEYYGERASNWVVMKKTYRRDNSFPPPLTSINGSGAGVRVESYREDGRLVLRAVTISSYFHAERSNGRLKLQLVKDITMRDKEEEEEEEGYWVNKEEMMRDENEDEEEMERENYGRRPCRCSKEGRHESKEMLNWEPLILIST